MTILGIDPGKSGAVAVLDEGGDLLEVHDMPSTLGVWSQLLMEHAYRVIRRMRYGPSSTWERHDDRGGPSSDTA